MLRAAKVALVLLLSSLSLSAPEPQESLRVSVRLVTVNVRVAQPDGSPVRNLAQSDFRLFEDGRQQAISVFEPLDAPMHVALLFDTSASTARDLELLRGAAERFLDEFTAADQFALYQVGPTVERLSAFTPDRKALKQALKRLQSAAGEGTLLHDALVQAHRDFHPEARRRAVVLFSDGADEGSQATYDDASLALLRGHGSLFAVLPQLGPPPVTPPSASAADGVWVVLFDLSGAGNKAIREMKNATEELLAELGPRAQVWLFDYRRYVRALRPPESSYRSSPANPGGLRVEDARVALKELGNPPPTFRGPQPPSTKTSAENLLVFTDPDRRGLTYLDQFFDLGNAIILVPEAISSERRRQILHMAVHQRGQIQHAVWTERRLAFERMEHLADDTGGEIWSIRGMDELAAAFRKIAEQIRSSYTLGYYSNAPPGRHQLRVEIPGRNLAVRSRQLVVTD
jgi:hypothetical protein